MLSILPETRTGVSGTEVSAAAGLLSRGQFRMNSPHGEQVTRDLGAASNQAGHTWEGSTQWLER
jgi:hypothetical protein